MTIYKREEKNMMEDILENKYRMDEGRIDYYRRKKRKKYVWRRLR